MSWVKTDHHFDRGAVLYVTQKHMVMEQQVFEVLRLHCADEPEHLESAVIHLIHKYRPELDGCVVWHMGFNASYGRWEFCVSHASLPRKAMYEEAKMLPLDPAHEREMSVT